MKITDVTRPVFSDMTVWPGDDPVLIERVCSISEGSVANITRISSGVHIGTHVDAPLHFIEGGKSVDQLDVNLFTGMVTVIDAGDEKCITRSMLSGLTIHEGDAVFFKTRYSNLSLNEPFDNDYTGLEPDAAEYLIRSGVRVVGTDALSVERFNSKNFIVHKTLLRNEVLIIEGLCLKNVRPGRYGYICMPMLINGSDGAPARVVIKEFI